MAGKGVGEAVRVAVRRLQGSHVPDGDLLARYADERDEAAFAELVRRHSGMVNGVARRLLANEQDAEDVCQAVFLLLSRKAASLGRSSVAGWLCSAARLTALNARKTRSRRNRKEASARPPQRISPAPLDQMTANELVAVLDEELARLPDRYRGPLVLCCLEGLSRDEAARRLGVSTPTLNVQLERGRDRLRALLVKRGIDLGVALLAVLVAPAAAVAKQRIVELVLRAAAGGEVPPAIAALIQGGTAVTKVKLMVALALVAGALATVGAAGFGARAAAPAPSAEAEVPADEKQPPTPQNRVAGKAKDTPPAEGAKSVTVQGRVLGPDGKPKATARLWLVGEGAQPTNLGTTGADGRFSVTIPGKRTGNAWSRYLVARAEAAGLDFLVLGGWKAGEPVELRLVKDNVIRGQVVNTEGKPVPGVHVFPEEINVHIDNSLDTFLAAYLRLLAGGRGTALLKGMRPGRAAPFGTTTDAAGRFTLHGVGAERTGRLHLHGGGVADTTVQVANRAGFKPEPYNKAFRDHFVAANRRQDQPWISYWMLSGPDVKVVATAEKAEVHTLKVSIIQNMGD
jgi:RNA polymerase sigma factor (sigma-70 family)